MANNMQTEVPPRDLQPSHEPDKFTQYVNILHPHYAEGYPLLLRLLAPDSNGTELEYAILSDACGVVAGNQWDGYFTTDNDPASDQVNTLYVKAGTYYFHVPGFSKTNPYPVVPSLQEWKFPHDKMPSAWKQLYRNIQRSTPQHNAPSNLSTSVRLLYQSCRMTDYREGTTIAHVCSVKHTPWASKNGMQLYATGSHSTVSRMLDSDANATLLRQDLHTLYDNNQFLFYPKGDGNKRLVVHLLAPVEDIGRRYHNRGLLPVMNVGVEYAFARFATTILEYVADFFAAGSARYALLAGGETKLMTAEECTIQSARSRSKSPKKRLRSDLAASEVLSMGSHDQNQDLQEVEDQSSNVQHRKRRKMASSLRSSSNSGDSVLPELSFGETDTENSSFELPEYQSRVIDWLNAVTTATPCKEASAKDDSAELCSPDEATSQHLSNINHRNSAEIPP